MSMELTIADLRSIKRAIEKPDFSVSVKTKWVQKLIEVYGGRPYFPQTHQKALSLDTIQIIKLRADLTNDFPLFKHCDQDLNRLEVAQLDKKEKLASLKPNDDYVLLKCSSGIIPLKNEDCVVPRNISYRIYIDDIDIKAIKRLMVIENLIAFDNIKQARISEELTDAIYVYRGDKEESRTIKSLNKLLERLDNETEVIGFFDFDPSGFKFANATIGIKRVILPKELSSEFVKSYSNKEKFYAQKDDRAFLVGQKLKTALRESADKILKNEMAVMQEHMLAHKIDLILLDV